MTKDSERPSLLRIWDGYRGATPSEEMERGLVLNIAWRAPLDFTKPIEEIPQQIEMHIAEYRLSRGPVGWVLMGRWGGDDEWKAVVEK